MDSSRFFWIHYLNVRANYILSKRAEVSIFENWLLWHGYEPIQIKEEKESSSYDKCHANKATRLSIHQ